MAIETKKLDISGKKAAVLYGALQFLCEKQPRDMQYIYHATMDRLRNNKDGRLAMTGAQQEIVLKALEGLDIPEAVEMRQQVLLTRKEYQAWLEAKNQPEPSPKDLLSRPWLLTKAVYDEKTRQAHMLAVYYYPQDAALSHGADADNFDNVAANLELSRPVDPEKLEDMAYRTGVNMARFYDEAEFNLYPGASPVTAALCQRIQDEGNNDPFQAGVKLYPMDVPDGDIKYLLDEMLEDMAMKLNNKSGGESYDD